MLFIIWLVFECLLVPETHMHMCAYTHTHTHTHTHTLPTVLTLFYHQETVSHELQGLLVPIRFHHPEDPTGDWRSNGTRNN